jgi:hypothetical protein
MTQERTKAQGILRGDGNGARSSFFAWFFHRKNVLHVQATLEQRLREAEKRLVAFHRQQASIL